MQKVRLTFEENYWTACWAEPSDWLAPWRTNKKNTELWSHGQQTLQEKGSRGTLPGRETNQVGSWGNNQQSTKRKSSVGLSTSPVLARQLRAVTPTPSKRCVPVKGGGTVNITQMPNYRKGRDSSTTLEGLVASRPTSPLPNLDFDQQEQAIVGLPEGA